MAGVSRLLLVLGVLASFAAWSAEPKRAWIALENCQYVPNKSNDGDSFHVNCAGDEIQLRLYFVDTPEMSNTYPERVREQADHFEVTADEALRWGARAHEHVREMLKTRFTVHTKKTVAPGRGKGARYYGLVEIDGKWLHELLVGEGLARTKGAVTPLPDGTKSSGHVKHLKMFELEARHRRRGIWAAAQPAGKGTK